jgi:hypothetical protein
MNVRSRLIAWFSVCTIGLVALVYWSYREIQRQQDAQDRQYELAAIAQVKSQLVHVKKGMSWPEVEQIIFKGVKGNPRKGTALHREISNEFGKRVDIFQEPNHRFLVFEYGPNYSAPLDSTGTPKDASGWQLLRFSESDLPYLK